MLIVANTTRKIDPALLEAALTLGTQSRQLLTRVVVPAILPDLYRDQRMLLGWAWTYLIVAELIGTTSGITWFITQQARYQHFPNVYAAIAMIGILGLGIDMILAADRPPAIPVGPPDGQERLNEAAAPKAADMNEMLLPRQLLPSYLKQSDEVASRASRSSSRAK